MPKGIIIIKWDDELGANLVAKYPENLKIPSKTLLNIYTNHRINNVKPGFASLNLADMKVLSFYTGMGKEFILASNYIIAFLLLRDEKPNSYRDLLKKSSAEILAHLNDKQYENQMPKIFQEMYNIS
jgi:hypothetical protein